MNTAGLPTAYEHGNRLTPVGSEMNVNYSHEPRCLAFACRIRAAASSTET